MSSQCRACLNTISIEFIHLGSDFSEEQTYFDCFNECTQLQATWDDGFSQVVCQTCLNTLHMVFDFIKTAQKSDKNLRSGHLSNKASTTEKTKSNETDIGNMNFIVLESLDEQILEEQALSEHNWATTSDNDDDDELLDTPQDLNFACQICNNCFESKAQLEQHLYDEHNANTKNAGFIALATCENCSKNFESNDILDLHMLIFHTPAEASANVTSCLLCKEFFETFEHIREHISLKHPSEYAKLFINIDETSNNNDDEDALIEACQSDAIDSAIEDQQHVDELENHSPVMLTTTINENQAKPFLCSFCPREFKNQKSLRQHEKIHFEATEDAVHICSDCNRQYSTATLLEQHRKNAHKLREYVCSICGNAFKLKNQLNNHMKLHLEKNILCPHCDKRYARRFDLNVHLRSHTGEMPYACHLCDKKFAIKVRLTYHLQKHYGIKHCCKECGAEFNSKPKLKAHSFKHTGMPYRCELCDDHGFPNRDVFKRHLLRVHNATITEEDLLEMFQRYTGKSTRILEVN